MNLRYFFLFIIFFGCSQIKESPKEKVKPEVIDPLPSWNEGVAKNQIISFVSQVTDENSSDYVKPEDRIAAFGNSDGDLQMLQYTSGGKGKRLLCLVHHHDAEREYAYDRDSHIGKLDKAWDIANEKGWVVASMKNDFKKVFAFQE